MHNSNWKQIKLGDCLKLVNGRAYKQHELLSEGTPVLRIQNLNGGINWYYSDLELPEKNYCNKGDLLFAWSATFGPYRWNGDKAIFHYHIWNVIPQNNIDVGFAYYLLLNISASVKEAAHGITMVHITKEKMENWLIQLPPLAEQKRIAAILDKADSLRLKNQQAIQLADRFLRAVFLDLFGDPMTNPKGWERCKFESLINMVTYGLTVRPEYLAEGVPLISAREIRSGQINFDGAPKISEKDFGKLSEKARPNFQDILFSKTGSIGHCAIVEGNLKFAVTQNAARIVPNTEKCEPLFLLSLLRTNYFFDLANREAKGNAVKDLQLGVMKEFPVYAPPMDIQRKYVEIFKRIKKLSSMNFDAQLDGNELFNSISQRAFAGEL